MDPIRTKGRRQSTRTRSKFQSFSFMAVSTTVCASSSQSSWRHAWPPPAPSANSSPGTIWITSSLIRVRVRKCCARAMNSCDSLWASNASLRLRDRRARLQPGQCQHQYCRYEEKSCPGRQCDCRSKPCGAAEPSITDQRHGGGAESRAERDIQEETHRHREATLPVRYHVQYRGEAAGRDDSRQGEVEWHGGHHDLDLRGIDGPAHRQDDEARDQANTQFAPPAPAAAEPVREPAPE